MTTPLTPAEIAWLDDPSVDTECRASNESARQLLRVRRTMRGDAKASAPATGPFASVRPTHFARRLGE